MVKVKICGITRVEDALYAAELGADALGFIFSPKSPRFVTPEVVFRIVTKLPPFVTTVGVFVNESLEKVHQYLQRSGLRIPQFHGDETPGYCNNFKGQLIKAFRVGKSFELDELKRYKANAFLFDAYSRNSYGGTGKKTNWDIAKKAREHGKIILAGGLNPQNIENAVKYVEPYAVDINSGVELKPGVKDPEKLKALLNKVKEIS